MKNTINHLKILILAIILSAGIGTLSAWTNPPGTPPTCPSGTPGCDAPLHIGAAGQIKSGGLSVGSGLTDAGVGFAVLGGKVGIGTATPTQKLDVAGYIKATTGFCIGTNCITSWPSGGGPTQTLACTEARRIQNNAPTIISGSASAIQSVGTGSASNESAFWGMQCVNGYKKTDCSIGASGGFNGGDVVYGIAGGFSGANYCLTDNEEFAAQSSLFITCCTLQ